VLAAREVVGVGRYVEDEAAEEGLQEDGVALALVEEVVPEEVEVSRGVAVVALLQEAGEELEAASLVGVDDSTILSHRRFLGVFGFCMAFWLPRAAIRISVKNGVLSILYCPYCDY
jgi:hypothetical protein